MADYSYIGKGSHFWKVRGVAGPKRNIGNVHGLSISTTNTERSLADFESISGGDVNSSTRIDSVTATLSLRSVSAENLAMVGLGQVTAVTGGAVTGEAHTAYIGGFLRTANNIDVTVAPVVTGSGGTPTYVADTDYSVRAAGIEILEGGAITDALDIEIDYTSLSGKTVEFIVDSAKEFEITFAGLNEAIDGNPMTVDIWRFKPDPFQDLAFVGDDYADISLTGKLLSDDTKVGSGVSKYFKAETVA